MKMFILKVFILFTLITKISADNNTTNSNAVETSTTLPGFMSSMNATTQALPAAVAESGVTKIPDTTVTTVTVSSKKEKSEQAKELKQATTTVETVTSNKDKPEQEEISKPAEESDATTPTPILQKQESATCALDQPHEKTTTKVAALEETTPTARIVTEPPRKPFLKSRMKFHGQHNHISNSDESESDEGKPQGPIPCTCGVFLSGQFKRGSKEQPKGVPVLTQEMDTPFMNNAMGNRQCTNKCLELIIKHLPKSSEIICATVDREHVFKERAYLFIKNHSDKWHGTNLSAGREFCCKENTPYKCPVN